MSTTAAHHPTVIPLDSRRPDAPPRSLRLLVEIELPPASLRADRVAERMEALVRAFAADVAALPGTRAAVARLPLARPVLTVPPEPGALTLDHAARIARLGAERIELTRLEHELLVALARRPGRVFTRSALLSEVWDDTFAIGTGRTVDVHTFRLRRKLGEAGKHLVTVRGVGYRWDGPAL